MRRPRAGSQRGRLSGRRQLAALGGILLTLAVVVIGAAAVYAFLQAQRRDRLAADYAAAVACLDRADYRCAVDKLDDLIREEPDYPAARAKRVAARLGLAGQYAAAGQWPAGIAELEAVLEDDPPTPSRWSRCATSTTAPSPTRSARVSGSRPCACACNATPDSATRRSNRCQLPKYCLLYTSDAADE